MTITRKDIVEQYKKKGRIYFPDDIVNGLNYDDFFVNKQFDNKNYCAVACAKGAERVIGIFKSKTAAIGFGIALGLNQVEAPR